MSAVGGQEAVELLLAEDNPTDAEMAIRALKRANMADKLVWVKDGEEVLEFLRREGRYANRSEGVPKVVLLDLKMPKIDGLGVLQRIRSDKALNKLPIVVLTSSREESDLARSYELGVNSYIVKSTSFAQLIEEMAKLAYYWLSMNRTPSAAT